MDNSIKIFCYYKKAYQSSYNTNFLYKYYNVAFTFALAV